MKKPTAMVIVGILITAAILGSVWMVTGGGQGLTLSLGGQQPSGAVDVNVVGSCADKGVRPVISAAAFEVDTTQNNKKTQVATTVIIAQPGGLILNQTTGSATASTDVSVPCGSKVAVLVGDGGGTTYYYNAVVADAIGISQSYYLEVKKSGAASITVNNDTSPGWASTITLGNNSITDPDSIGLRIEPPTTAGAYFGDLGYGACVKYASLNFTNVYPQPNAGMTSIAHVGGTSAHDAVRCYDMPGILVSGGNVYTGTLFFDKVATAFQNSTISIDMTIVDKTTGVFNNLPYSGYDSSASGGDMQNTDLGRADVTTSNLLNITGVPA